MRWIATTAAAFVAVLAFGALMAGEERERPEAGSRPNPPAGLGAGEALARTIEDLSAAATVRYDVKARDGTRMEALDVVSTVLLDRPLYLGVAHRRRAGRFVTGLFASDDLRSWRHVRDLQDRASQGALTALPDGGWLLAVEIDEAGPDGVRRGHLRFLRYPTDDALAQGRPDWRYDAPRTLSKVAGAFEGTPSLRRITATSAEVGFHYLTADAVDRNARATLSGIGTAAPRWVARPAPDIDDPLERSGVEGNIGDRTHVAFRGVPLTLVEGQRRPRDFGSWSVYVLDPARTDARRLAFRTPGGSGSFGNAAAGVVPLPGGGRGVLLTAYVFTEGAADGEAGQMLAVFPVDG